MSDKKKLSIVWLLLGLINVCAFLGTAQDGDFTVTIGEDKVFTEFNCHESWFEDDPNNPEPWPDQRETYSEGNLAYVSLIATPGHAGVAQSKVGVDFELNLGSYTWEEVKDWPVKVIINFSYHIEAYWAEGNGSANAGVSHGGFLTESAYDFIGFEVGQAGSRGDTGSETYTTTVEELGGNWSMQAYCQAHSIYWEDEEGNPIGTTHHSCAEVTVEQIKIEFVPEWRKNLRPGDLVFYRDSSNPFSKILYYTHVGLYKGNDEVLEAHGMPFLFGGVRTASINKWANKEAAIIYRVKGADTQMISKAISFIENKIGQPYQYAWVGKDLFGLYGWYCSELIWAAFKQWIDLAATPNPLIAISPDEIALDDDVEFVGGYSGDITFGTGMIIRAHSPIDMNVADPGGFTVSKDLIEIEGAYYAIIDTDWDGDPEDIAAIPKEQLKPGVYSTEVIPKPDASPTDTYTLEVTDHTGSTTLAEDIPVSGIPEEPYDYDYTPPPTEAVFRVDDQGNVYADQGYHGSGFYSGSADVAEWVSVLDLVEPGDVLELDPTTPGQYRKARGPCSDLVAGVVSTEPGVVLGAGDNAEGRVLLALLGIVPVKVTNEGGPIQPGDLLVTSSTPGYAMRWDPDASSPCDFVGKALEPLAEETGIILVLLMSH